MTSLSLTLLRQARRARNFSTEQAGKLLGKDRTTIWRYETGQSDITVGMLCRMLDLYGITPHDVFVQEEN